MAGTDSRFDATVFRDAILFAMNMGLPDSTSERATFKWTEVNTFSKADSSENPWTWDATATTTSSFEDVQIPVAVELQRGTETDSRFGAMHQQTAIITVLDTYWPDLTQDDVFANQVEFNGELFDIQFVEPPQGLFDVTVYTIHARAVDLSS